ncbi:probable serine/threonine-protein kinase kinX [Drosophila takahashii]|uniref:probable serine/threonine-protein kinase kinX n=1 Tax=Drosophila takahashii TaxID=29030 RepID=UPI001CF8A32E|nr:probable serine/threonine-protein kinase fhkB [Drosophila takahashii]
MLLLLLLLGLASVVSLADGYDRSVNYWEAFAPGKLLQRLDALTVGEAAQSNRMVAKLPEMMQPVQTQAQAKADEDLEDVDVDVEEAEAEDSHEGYSGEDYERNYEQFVKEYFDRAAENHDNHDDDDDDEEDLAEETQAEATSVKDQRCRRVKRKDGQLCEICRQLKNNEVSETCSYSHDDQPEQYAFGSGTQYKRYRNNDPAEKQEKEQKQEQDDAPSSLCVRRQQGNRVCYECKDSKGQKIERCYKTKARKKKASAASSAKRKPRSQQSQQSEQEQRIYKRTISYSYAQGSDQDQQQEQPPVATTEQPVPRQRRRRLVKITRRRGPVRVQ